MKTEMKTPLNNLLTVLTGMALTQAAASLAAEPASPKNDLTFESRDGALAISYGGQRVADYVYRDEKIPRPYFANLCAPGGIQVTRSHPPVPGKDATDHDVLHPGVWLAFADLSGQDSWRNLAAIKHERFSEPPAVRDGRLTFATESRMQTTNGQALCALQSRFTVAAWPAGWLLIWDATFVATEQDIAFGDQEEMGFGVRVATPITEKSGGLITTSTGGKTAKATWGKAFEWCDYAGVIGDQRVGVTLMPDPANFRPSWFHNRDYGLMVANPFGRNSMKQGEVSRVEVKKGEKLRLRFGLLLHAVAPDQNADLATACRDFLGLSPK
jgi:hypothetical protein